MPRRRHLHHVWQLDLTLVPTTSGLWVPWLPFAKLPRWPFAWWLAVVIDAFSRKVVGFRLFKAPPSAADICALLRGSVKSAEVAPKYLVSDKGPQFVADAYREWCRNEGIGERYAAADSLRATAIVERFFRSLKTEWLRRVRIPLRLAETPRSTCALPTTRTRRDAEGRDARSSPTSTPSIATRCYPSSRSTPPHRQRSQALVRDPVVATAELRLALRGIDDVRSRRDESIVAS